MKAGRFYLLTENKNKTSEKSVQLFPDEWSLLNPGKPSKRHVSGLPCSYCGSCVHICAGTYMCMYTNMHTNIWLVTDTVSFYF